MEFPILWCYGKPGVAGYGEGELDSPMGADELPGGSILIADGHNSRVIVVDRETRRIVWQFGETRRPGDGHKLWLPHSAYHIRRGPFKDCVLIADRGNRRVLMVSLDDRSIEWEFRNVGRHPETASPSPWENPKHIYVCDGEEGAIRKIDLATCEIVWDFSMEGAQFETAYPFAKAGEPEYDGKEEILSHWWTTKRPGSEYKGSLGGDFVVANWAQHCVMEIRESDKKVVWQYGTTGEPGNTFNHLWWGLVVARQEFGDTIIADQGAGRIIVVGPNRQVKWQAGFASLPFRELTGRSSFLASGSFSFYQPHRGRLTSRGTLLMSAESLGNVVYEIPFLADSWPPFETYRLAEGRPAASAWEDTQIAETRWFGHKTLQVVNEGDVPLEWVVAASSGANSPEPEEWPWVRLSAPKLLPPGESDWVDVTAAFSFMKVQARCAVPGGSAKFSATLEGRADGR